MSSSRKDESTICSAQGVISERGGSDTAENCDAVNVSGQQSAQRKGKDEQIIESLEGELSQLLNSDNNNNNQKSTEDGSELEGENIAQSSATSVAESSRSDTVREKARSSSTASSSAKANDTALQEENVSNRQQPPVKTPQRRNSSQSTESHSSKSVEKRPMVSKTWSEESQLSHDSSGGSTQKVSNRQAQQPQEVVKSPQQRRNSTASQDSNQELMTQQYQQQRRNSLQQEPTPQQQKPQQGPKQENTTKIPVQKVQAAQQPKASQGQRKGRFKIQPYPSNDSLPALDEHSPSKPEPQPQQSLSPKLSRNLPPQHQQTVSQHQQQQQQQQQHGGSIEGSAPQFVAYQNPPVVAQPEQFQNPAAPPPTVVGMVGNLPIVAIPGTDGQVVRKKKGRFKVLGEIAEPPPPGTTSGVATERPRQQQHARSVSVSSFPTVASGKAALSSGRSLDGTGGQEPVIKKKGRFVVTNVTVPIQTVVTTSQHALPMEQTVMQAPMMMAPADQTVMQTPVMMAPAGQLYYTTAPAAQGTAMMTTPALQHPVIGIQPESVGPPPPIPASQRAHSPVPGTMNSSIESGSPSMHHQQQGQRQQPTQPYAEETTSSNYQQQQVHQPTVLPFDETVPKTNKPRPQPRAARPGAVRHSSPGLVGQQGFGKMYYLLDQMKQEVGEADRTIKNLQTDMRCMKERNKELEAKAREMERKWNAEKALREVAETRVKALKKKLRSQKDSQELQDAAREDESVGTQQTGGRHSRAGSMDAAIEFSDIAQANSENVSVANSDSSKYCGEQGQPGSGATIVDKTSSQPLGTSSTGSASSKRGSTVGPSNTSPLRDTVIRPLPGQQSAAQKPSASAPATGKGLEGNNLNARSNSIAPSGARNLSRSVSCTGASNKPNLLRQQQIPPVNAGNVNASIDMSKNASNGLGLQKAQGGPPSINAQGGVPPRPMGSRIRNESAGSLGSSRPPNSIGFDPLQPSQHQSDDNLSLISDPDSGMQNLYSSTPVLMMNHPQTMTVPIVGVAPQGMSDSDLMSFQPPLMQVAHPQGEFQQQSGNWHQQIPSGMLFVPQQQVTMQAYHDQPPPGGTQESSQQGPMMSLQQPVLHFQPSGMATAQQLQWTTSQQQPSQQQQQQPPPQDLLSSQPASQPAAQPSPLEQPSDPFDALVQERRPGNIQQPI